MEVTIMALPREDERVNDVSSEKAAHMTLLYLGEVADEQTVAQITDYVRHTVENIDGPFFMETDHRGTLGPAEADVLFFRKDKSLNQFRWFLLQDDTIRKAYDATEQFPEFTPHLTLGYPASPAHDKDSEERRQLGFVFFDRIAVWTGDSAGTEFRLEYNRSDLEDSPMAMSDVGKTAAEELFHTDVSNPIVDFVNELFHYGKKGMKWGVRNDNGHEGEKVKVAKLDKMDKKWEAANQGRAGQMAAYNEAARKMNDVEIDRINNKPEHKKAADEGKFEDWERPTPELQAYMNDYERTFNQQIAEATVRLGKNPSGTKEFVIDTDADGQPYASLQTIKHAAGDKSVRYKLNRNKNGAVTSFTEEEVELKHYGVPGMRWGHTTRGGTHGTRTKSEPTPVKVEQTKPGTFAKSSGGAKHPLHPDAEPAIAARQKAKGSTTDALSNDELRRANERLQLEANFNKLTATNDRRSAGARFAAGFFGIKKADPKVDQNENNGEQIRKVVDDILRERSAKPDN